MSEGHSHSHSHSHELAGSWNVWREVPILRATLGAVAGLGVLTVLGLVLFWPNGSGREPALTEARFMGLAHENYEATVESVFEGECESEFVAPYPCRAFTVLLQEGPDADTILSLDPYVLDQGFPAPVQSPGDQVIVAFEPQTGSYWLEDQDRELPLLWLALAFAVVVVAFGRWRGLAALGAMVVTVGVLVVFVVPSILDGRDPVVVAVLACSAIAFITLYLTHGFSPTTTVALAGTLASLLVTLAVSSIFFSAARFTGLASTDGLTLVQLTNQQINLSSLLLAGAMLGALGALDDITVTQVATVAELHHRSPQLTVAELITSGIRVGREHIASTVNTLLLAYAGASIPLLLVRAASDQGLGTTANSEEVAVEIVRTLCGSMGLVAAVPITTVLAALLVGTAPDEGDESQPADFDGSAGPAQTSAEPAPDVAESPRTRPRTEASWDDFAPPNEEDWPSF